MALLATGSITFTEQFDEVYALLSSDAGQVSVDNAGTPKTPLATLPLATTMSVYKANVLQTGWTFTRTQSGATSSINGSTGVLTVTGISADSAYVDITAAKAGEPSLTKRYVMTKVYQGETGPTGPTGPAGTPGYIGLSPAGNVLSLKGFNSDGTFGASTGYIYVKGVRCTVGQATLTATHTGPGYILANTSNPGSTTVSFARLVPNSNGESAWMEWRDYNANTVLSTNASWFVIGSFNFNGTSFTASEITAPIALDVLLRTRFMEIMDTVSSATDATLNLWAKAMGVDRVLGKVAILEAFINSLIVTTLQQTEEGVTATMSKGGIRLSRMVAGEDVEAFSATPDGIVKARNFEALESLKAVNCDLDGRMNAGAGSTFAGDIVTPSLVTQQGETVSFSSATAIATKNAEIAKIKSGLTLVDSSQTRSYQYASKAGSTIGSGYSLASTQYLVAQDKIREGAEASSYPPERYQIIAIDASISNPTSSGTLTAKLVRLDLSTGAYTDLFTETFAYTAKLANELDVLYRIEMAYMGNGKYLLYKAKSVYNDNSNQASINFTFQRVLSGVYTNVALDLTSPYFNEWSGSGGSYTTFGVQMAADIISGMMGGDDYVVMQAGSAYSTWHTLMTVAYTYGQASIVFVNTNYSNSPPRGFNACIKLTGSPRRIVVVGGGNSSASPNSYSNCRTSDNNGLTWTNRSIGAAYRLRNVSLTRDGFLYAVEDNGSVWVSTDSGVGWMHVMGNNTYSGCRDAGTANDYALMLAYTGNTRRSYDQSSFETSDSLGGHKFLYYNGNMYLLKQGSSALALYQYPDTVTAGGTPNRTMATTVANFSKVVVEQTDAVTRIVYIHKSFASRYSMTFTYASFLKILRDMEFPSQVNVNISKAALVYGAVFN